MNDALGVIFDVDGVLVDSCDAHFESWQIVGRERGFGLSWSHFVQTFGRTTREVLRESLGESRFNSGEIAEIDERKEAVFRDLLAPRFPIMEGAVELIDQLQAAGFRLAVGSSGPPENVQLVLRELERGSAFRGVVTGVDVTRGKPDPQVFQLAAEALGLAPSRCAVIEDAPAGVQAALNARMTCIGFVSKGHTVEQLRLAHHLVHRLQELSPSTIQRLLAGQHA